jgi:hypothetical protein
MSTKEIKTWKNEKKQKSSGEYFYYFFYVPLTLPYTTTSSWWGRSDTPCIILKIQLTFKSAKILFR